MRDSILARAKQVVDIDTDTYRALCIFSVTISILSLAVPVAAQTLINFIAFANLLQPIIILCSIVLFVFITSACLRIYQIRLVEWIQCRVFVDTGLKSVEVFTRLKDAETNKFKYKELVNYFFDITIIKKSLASLMTSSLEAILRTFFSMVLLATYHPWLLMFDICLIISIILVIYLPFKTAVYTAIDECSAKHEVAAWIEEIGNMPIFFKLLDYPAKAVKIIDNKLSFFLLKREKHFSSLINQVTFIYVIVIVSSVALLWLGAYLVIRGQLTLGQLVASEIVLTAMSASFIKLANYLDDVYDGLASAYKVYELYNLPLEEKPHYSQKQAKRVKVNFENSMQLKLNQLTLSNDIDKNKLDITLQPGGNFVLLSDTDIICQMFVDVLLGLRAPPSGTIYINDTLLTVETYHIARQFIGLVNSFVFVNDDLAYNLLLSDDLGNNPNLQSMLSAFNLQKSVEKLTDGLRTSIVEVSNQFTQFQLLQLNIIRLLLAKPKILILDRIIDRFSEPEYIEILTGIKTVDPELIIIAASRNRKSIDHFERHLLL